MEIRVVDITHDSVVDGPGLRTVIWFSGCDHKCPGCHNPKLWDFKAGQGIEAADLANEVKDCKRITLSGGDPLYQLEALDEFVSYLDPEVDLWIYTGFNVLETRNLIGETKHLRNRKFTIKIGPFVKDLMDRTALYRGSNNQRIYKYEDEIFTDISDKIDRGDI